MIGGMSAQEAQPPSRLPRGPHRLGRDVVRASQRSRLLEAMTAEVADRGYAATSVQHVLRAAGVSRSTFYELFLDKSACFLAALDLGITRIAHDIEAAVAAETQHSARGPAGFRALCRGLAEDPAFARISLIRAPEAGDVAHAHQQVIRDGAVVMIRDMVRTGQRGTATPCEVSEAAVRALVGGIETLLAHHVETRGAESLVDLAETLGAVMSALLQAEVPDVGA